MDGDGYPASQIGTQLQFFTNQQQQIDQKQVKSQILFICLEARQWQGIVCDQYDGSFMYVRPGADPTSPDLTEGIDVVHSQFIYGGDNSDDIPECYNELFESYVVNTYLGRQQLIRNSHKLGTDEIQQERDGDTTSNSAKRQRLEQEEKILNKKSYGHSRRWKILN